MRSRRLIGAAGKVFLIGLGEDSVSAQAFAAKLSLLGFVAVFHADPVLMSSGISTVAAKDVLLVFSEHGKQPTLYQICRQFRERRGKVISVTRHTANPLRAHADASLLVSAHDERAHIEPLLYQSALQHLLDLILCCCARMERKVEAAGCEPGKDSAPPGAVERSFSDRVDDRRVLLVERALRLQIFRELLARFLVEARESQASIRCLLQRSDRFAVTREIA